jgi:hypothetical protein
MMATMIALLATIESTGAAVVLLPHGAEPPRHSPATDSTSLSSPSGQARAKLGDFELHRRANVRAFGIIVVGGDGGTLFDVHHGRRRRRQHR